MAARVLSAVREHRALSVLMALGAALRAAAEAAYWPALSYAGDSSLYLKLAWTGSPVGSAPERPSGYAFALDLLTEPGKQLSNLTIAQHAAGLATAVLVYAIARRISLPKWAAAGAAGLVLLNSHQIVLEQMILAEALFTLALVASMYLALGPERGPWALAASGALLGSAATMRLAALYAVPIWAIYVLWVHRPRLAMAAAAGLAVPVLAYSTWHAAEEGSFGFDQASGWFLYGRVAEIGDCDGANIPQKARPLCDRVPRDDTEGAGWHLWDAYGSAHRVFGRLGGTPERVERTDEAMGAFARAIIRDRPGRYAGLVAEDVLRYFTPGARARYISDLAVAFPASDQLGQLAPTTAERYVPEFTPRRRAPADALDAYESVFHTPRWLMAALVLVALAALAVGAVRRRLSRGREILLLSGSALAMLVGATATSEFVFRYFVPLVPLVACGGLAAALTLVELRRPTAEGLPSREGRRAQEPARRADYTEQGLAR